MDIIYVSPIERVTERAGCGSDEVFQIYQAHHHRTHFTIRISAPIAISFLAKVTSENICDVQSFRRWIRTCLQKRTPDWVSETSHRLNCAGCTVFVCSFVSFIYIFQHNFSDPHRLVYKRAFYRLNESRQKTRQAHTPTPATFIEQFVHLYNLLNDFNEKTPKCSNHFTFVKMTTHSVICNSFYFANFIVRILFHFEYCSHAVRRILSAQHNFQATQPMKQHTHTHTQFSFRGGFSFANLLSFDIAVHRTHAENFHSHCMVNIWVWMNFVATL